MVRGQAEFILYEINNDDYYSTLRESLTDLAKTTTQMGELKEANSQMLEDLKNLTPLLGEAFESLLLEEIETYEKLWEYYVSLRDYYAIMASDPKFGFAYWGMADWCDSMIGMADKEIEKRKDVLEQVAAFNSYGGDAYKGIMSRMDMLNALLDSLRSGKITTPAAVSQYLAAIDATREGNRIPSGLGINGYGVMRC